MVRALMVADLLWWMVMAVGFVEKLMLQITTRWRCHIIGVAIKMLIIVMTMELLNIKKVVIVMILPVGHFLGTTV